MNTVDIILKKRNGSKFSKTEIDFIISSYTKGIISDYQMSALLMTFYFVPLTYRETKHLTNAMINSGDVLDLSKIKGIKVDKHSTGGVGDKITLIVAPIVAAAGVKIAKMSGRGLGFTGGTIDKLEAIPGFKTDISEDLFINNVNKIGIAVMGQSENIAKADKLMYALRDVTGTVDIESLIASSIMSKKIASGSDAILLDVKFGDGALMKTYEDAKSLGELMKKIGNDFDKKVEITLSSMEEPLGKTVGNAIEVIEAIEILKGNGDENLIKLGCSIAGEMILLGEKAKTKEEAVTLAQNIIKNGKGLAKFKEWVIAQGGNGDVVTDYSLFPQSKEKIVIKGEELKLQNSNKITSIKASQIGEASRLCGAGRLSKTDSIDLSAGIILNKKERDTVTKDDIICILVGNNKEKLTLGKKAVLTAFD